MSKDKAKANLWYKCIYCAQEQCHYHGYIGVSPFCCISLSLLLFSCICPFNISCLPTWVPQPFPDSGDLINKLIPVYIINKSDSEYTTYV